MAATTGLAASTGFNVGHLAATDLPGRLTAAVPPVAAFGGLFIGLQVLKYIEDASQVAADRRRVPVAGAVSLAATLVAADRLHNGRTASSDYSHEDGHPALGARARATELEAAVQCLASTEPEISGAELARRIGVPERTGRWLLQRLRAST